MKIRLLNLSRVIGSAVILGIFVSLLSAATEPKEDPAEKSSRKPKTNGPALSTADAPLKKTTTNTVRPSLPSKNDPKGESEEPKKSPSNSKTPATKKIVDSEATIQLVPSSTKTQVPAKVRDNEEGECPGSEGSSVSKNDTKDDVPLDQEEHPFDAPAAKSDESPSHTSQLRQGKAKSIKDEGDESSEAKQLQRKIDQCLAYYFAHEESLVKRSPWAVMHTILPYGVETEISAGNRSVNAIGWMCYNGVCKSQRMFQSTQSGFRTNVGPGVQGHEGQFLAILAQSSVPRDFPIIVGKTRYKVNDLIRYEMSTCREKSELTFKLIAFAHYLSARHVWRDDRGQTWNLEKLVKEELDQPVVGAACGGTHRLMGLSYALMMRRRYNEPIVNNWARAEAYVDDFVQYAWTLQNPDGSFSTNWFEGRANEPDIERKVQTTGHILEWLIFTLPAERLDDPRIAEALNFLLANIYDQRDKAWPIGPRGHSLRAMALYNQRVYGAPTGGLKNYLAQAGYATDLR